MEWMLARKGDDYLLVWIICLCFELLFANRAVLLECRSYDSYDEVRRMGEGTYIHFPKPPSVVHR